MHLSCYTGPLCWQWVTNPTAGEFTVRFIQPAREWELRAACWVGAGSPRRAAARWKGTFLCWPAGRCGAAPGRCQLPDAQRLSSPGWSRAAEVGQDQAGGGSTRGTGGRSQPADGDTELRGGSQPCRSLRGWAGGLLEDLCSRGA